MSITKSKKPRIRRSPEASRENILAAAEALLVEKGPQSLKLVDVAASAGVANATVLHHFGSIDGVQTALMERMIDQLVANVFAAHESDDDPDAEQDRAFKTLFDAFETRGAARLAAWLELTDESRRMTMVRQAVNQVVVGHMQRTGRSQAESENLVLISVVVAMGVGLFGRTLGTLIGKPPDRARKLAVELLHGHRTALEAGAPRPRKHC